MWQGRRRCLLTGCKHHRLVEFAVQQQAGQYFSSFFVLTEQSGMPLQTEIALAQRVAPLLMPEPSSFGQGLIRFNPGVATQPAICSAQAIVRIRPVPAQPAQGQNCGYEESPGSPAYPPSTACGPPAVCIHGRSRRCIEGFPGGLDSQLLIAG